MYIIQYIYANINIQSIYIFTSSMKIINIHIFIISKRYSKKLRNI